MSHGFDVADVVVVTLVVAVAVDVDDGVDVVVAVDVDKLELSKISCRFFVASWLSISITVITKQDRLKRRDENCRQLNDR